MERIIRLKDGSEYPCEMCGEYAGQLWIQTHMEMAEACAVFMNKTSIETITDTYAGEDGKLREVVWVGYTELFHLSIANGYLQIGLRKDDWK